MSNHDKYDQETRNEPPEVGRDGKSCYPGLPPPEVQEGPESVSDLAVPGVGGRVGWRRACGGYTTVPAGRKPFPEDCKFNL